jgi:non-ribosomal peptide synthase protein (TIGR01720 family)
MKTIEEEIIRRIAALTAEQRGMLAELMVMPGEAEETLRSGDRLVAYIVPAQPRQGWPSAELRDFLRERLPEHMIPAEFVLLDELPRLSNGKVDLGALPAPSSSWTEPSEGYVPPRTSTEQALAGIWAGVLGTDLIGIHDNFFEIGGDSILSIQVVARANRVGLTLAPDQLFHHQTIAALAAVVGTSTIAAAEQGLVSGPVPLTPIQHWFFEQPLPERHHWHHALWLEIPSTTETSFLEEAVRHLKRHHDALRLRFTQDDAGWRQVHAPDEDSAAVSLADLSDLPADEQEAALRKAVDRAAANTDLAGGELIRVARFRRGGGQWDRILITIHHLVVDPISWGTIVEDLQTALGQLSRGERVALPPKTTSFRAWAEVLVARGDQPRASDRDHWLNLPQVAPRLPRNGSAVFTEETAETVAVVLGREETGSLLSEAPAAYNSNPEEILLTALVQTVGAWSGAARVLVGLERHGRDIRSEGIDLSRTVGWFTAFFPVLLELEGIREPGPAIKAIKEQLRRVPDGGLGYGVLRYLGADRTLIAHLRALPQPEVLFNYSRQPPAPVAAYGVPRLAGLPGSSRGGANQRTHVLEINAFTDGGRLELHWGYSRAIHDRATIERLARGHLEAVRALIAHCLSPDAGGYTPSDFPSAGLSQGELDRFVDRLFT